MRHLALLLCAAAAAFAVPASASAVTAREAIAFLNEQRIANGIPGGIVEDPQWSEGCRLHMAYLQRNGLGLSHDEDPSLPGYTELGAEAGRSAVLTSHGYEQDGRNPWENAPIHLMQLLTPTLSVTGYSNGCMWTWPGYQRPEPARPALYTYPGPRAQTVSHLQNAAESPFVPGDFVGLQQGVTTGPHLYVMAFGAGRGRLTSASLSGPSGPVSVRTVDNETSSSLGELGASLPPGGIIIPTASLAPGGTYTVSASFTDGVSKLSRRWSFRTKSDRPSAQARLKINRRRITFTSRNKHPVTLTIRRRRSARIVLKRTVGLPATGRVTHPLSLRPARHDACAVQAATPLWSPVRICVSTYWRARAGARWGTITRKLAIFRSGMAAGKRARISRQPLTRRCSQRRCRYRASGRRQTRLVRLAPRQRIPLGPADGYRLQVTTGKFGRGDLLYAPVSATRLVRR